jgi:release factor glutamine methyltransferase
VTGTEPETIGRALARATRRLRGTGSGAVDARRLMTFATGWEGAALIVHRDDVVDEDELAIFDGAIARRERGEPVAYIVGSAGFYGRSFTVSPAVLVPRPESEHVVEAAIAELQARTPERRRAADIGTGSGILAITLACEVPGAKVFATDASADALAIASANARTLGVHKHVKFFEGDLAAPLADRGPLDVVIANLPYVPSRDVPQAPDPVSFEPHVAVDGGPDGLDLYRRLVTQLPPLLAPGAALFFEAAPPTIEALAELVGSAFSNAHVEVGEDYAGLERFVSAHVP